LQQGDQIERILGFLIVFVKISVVVQGFWLIFYAKSHALIITHNGLGYIVGDFIHKRF
jgi:hypothetical protein